MAYSQGGLIEASDYNTFVSNINSIWGVGSGDSGYGQTGTLTTVALSNTITATQWATLIARLDSLRNHQSGVTSGLTQPSTGDVIEYLNILNSQISTATSNRLSNNEGIVTAATANATGTWDGTVQADRECTFTFASANQMRYFFNAGGYITFNVVNSSFSGNTKSSNWDTLADNLATQTINSGNFYSLSTSNSTRASATGSGADYASNILYLQARLNAAPGASTVLTLRALFADNSADTFDDVVTGTARLDATAHEANATAITNSWGTVTGASNVTVTQS